VIRVFVVDDSPFVRKAIRRVLAAEPGVEVVGEAATGADALTRIPAAEPHVVTLDVEMQGIDGLQVLRQLLVWRPGLRVIMLSAHTRAGAEATLEALAAGAADFLDKQSLNLLDLDRLGRELGERIRLLADKPLRRSAPARREARPPALDGAELCVIGASTGGPAALQYLLERLPVDFPLPIAVVQHMPVGFTAPFAARLDGLCRLEVKQAADGDRLVPGTVVIAPAGMHLRVSTSLAAIVSPEPAEERHVPSVDVLFRSADRARPGRVLGILLTGMGEDGAAGLSLIRAHGGVTIAESEETCAVYGMPRAAVQRGAAVHVLPLPAIAEALGALAEGPRPRPA
jgi:two-component system, chemotaxis family, protein-glutamate methylesterase/glutaminase